MGAVTRLSAILLTLVAASACGEIAGLADTSAPLAQINVWVRGEIPPQAGGTPRPARPRVALVWGKQWMPEPFCFLPPGSEEAAAVVEAGCRDSFGFVPERVAANAAVGADGRATLALLDLPAADVMVGDVTARVAYGSLLVYDDRNDNGALDLRRPRRVRGGDDEDEGKEEEPAEEDLAERLDEDTDIVHGASFVSMTRPDQRVAFREGGFSLAAAFYPRHGCPPPPEGFSVVGAGGFSAVGALQSTLKGELPSQDPSLCTTESLEDAVVTVPVSNPEDLSELACTTRRWGVSIGGSTRYYSPERAPEIEGRKWACVGLPRLGGDEEGKPKEGEGAAMQQLVVASDKGDACKSVSHFLLAGCDRDPDCERPEWDLSESPPEWWPCGVSK